MLESIPKESQDIILNWLKDFSFKDSDEVYTNGSTLVPLFRVRQALELYKIGRIDFYQR